MLYVYGSCSCSRQHAENCCLNFFPPFSRLVQKFPSNYCSPPRAKKKEKTRLYPT